jgi:glycosyltransferase involved in cell wall biosynthesis
MKVAVNTLFLIPGEVGGSEIYLVETLRAVIAHHPEITLALITNRENDGWLRERFAASGRCTFHPMALRATNRYARILAEQLVLPAMVRRVRPDVLWSPGYTMPAWAPCRQVVSLLDMQYRTHPEDLSHLARWTTHALVCMAVRRADVILAISEFSRQEVVRETGCPAERIVVSPLGVDAMFSRDVGPVRRADVQARYVGRAVPLILSVANSYPHKNLALLVEAFTAIADRIPHHLLLVGKARRGEAELLAALAAAPADRIHRSPSAGREDVAALMQVSDLFAFPSLYEGFGLPVLEALAAGTPVLATGEGSTREVGGDVATYADGRDRAAWAEALLRMATDPAAERARVQVAGPHRAALFSWRVTADLSVQAWQRACQKGLAQLSQVS